MTLAEVKRRLKNAGIDSYEYDAEVLFDSFSGYTKRDRLLTREVDSASETLASAVARRCEREPLQYIIGTVGFYREEYKVTPDVLIPRADTEHLVDYAVRNIPEGECFLDLCSGSGCVGISTLNNTKNTTATLVDISPLALDVARENARLNDVDGRITFIEADVTRSIPEGEVYAVLSNPPYIARSVYEALEPEIGYEPEIAFVGGEDGGDFYRLIVPMAKRVIKKEGFIALEIGYDQRELLKALATEHEMSLEIIKDYSGNDRVAVLKMR